MLTALRISNFALIDELSLELSQGFHVLTGETGAGKSIIVDAIALLMGGRASTEHIRAEADEAVLEAALTLPASGPITDRLRANDVVGPHDTEIIVRRVLSRSGRNRIYLNGNLAPLHLLQSLAGTLIDIHGQHEQQSLLAPQAQLDVLDAFGHLKGLRAEYGSLYEVWKGCQRDLEEATRAADSRSEREDLLRFQSRELEEADFQPGEEETLTIERGRLSHSRRLAELAEMAYAVLYEGDSTVLGGLGSVGQHLRELRQIDPRMKELGDLSDTAMVQLREVAARLRDYRQELQEDPERLGRVEDRLALIQRLKKKYGGSMDALLARAQELKQEIEALTNADTHLAELKNRVSREGGRVQELAQRLSEGRKGAAAKLDHRVKQELGALRMDRTRFQTELASDRDMTALGPVGWDRVEFLFSANQGEPLLPLARVASGGELSRMMLAMKTVLAETDHVPVLIFDEVDAGVGGAVAAVMGKRLRALARYHQVFCITHLPQIAAQAESHFVVEKEVAKKRTVTRVRRLEAKARQEEVARMLGGLAITKAMRDTAADMLGEAERQPS